MIDKETLAKWSRMPDGADRYLRPLVARGPLQRSGAVVVGLNPATEIGPSDLPFDAYVDLLLDLDAFTEFYCALRVKRNKSRITPTRRGLNGMARLLGTLGWHSVVDTNISPYPTERGEDLDEISLRLQSREIFHEVVHSLAPRLLVLHGEDALSEFTRSIAPALAPPYGTAFSALVEQSPRLGRMNWPDGEPCEVFVCRHLRFFGHAGGPRFAALIDALVEAGGQTRSH